MGVGGSFFPRATSITTQANNRIITNDCGHPAEQLTPDNATRGERK